MFFRIFRIFNFSPFFRLFEIQDLGVYGRPAGSYSSPDFFIPSNWASFAKFGMIIPCKVLRKGFQRFFEFSKFWRFFDFWNPGLRRLWTAGGGHFSSWALHGKHRNELTTYTDIDFSDDHWTTRIRSGTWTIFCPFEIQDLGVFWMLGCPNTS